MTFRTQSKRASLVEAVVNTVVGFAVAIVGNYVLNYIYGVHASMWQLFNIASWMTVVSVVRSYLLRRAWNSEFWLRWSWRRPFLLKPHAAVITGYRTDTKAPIYGAKTYISPEASAAIAAKLKAHGKELRPPTPYTVCECHMIPPTQCPDADNAGVWNHMADGAPR